MPSTTIGRGNLLIDTVIGPTLTPSSVALSTSAEQTFAVLGVQMGDIIDVNFSGAQTAGIGIVNVRVPSNGNIAVTFSNSTAGALVPASGMYYINVQRPENLPLPAVLN
jgi:hypothetical protein